MSFFPGKRSVSLFPGNDAKKMLFLSLYFKAIKYTIKASVNVKKNNFRIRIEKER
jgi:hypothetical protein